MIMGGKGKRGLIGNNWGKKRNILNIRTTHEYVNLIQFTKYVQKMCACFTNLCNSIGFFLWFLLGNSPDPHMTHKILCLSK